MLPRAAVHLRALVRLDLLRVAGAWPRDYAAKNETDAKKKLALINAWTGNGVEPDRPLLHPLQPEGAITQLVERYLGSTRRAGQGTLPEGTPSGEEEVLARAGFSRPRTLAVPDDRVITRTTDEVVASVFAVSRSAPHLFGDRLAEFDRELRVLLLEASPDGLFSAQAAENKVRVVTRN